ncbi:hypothetical protein OH76DRAFT_1395828 [Lentinus brumalis]|uniref:Uncharacterized protein n=1 Tax=Lentinus brumalis TaxID=2498619 RepID=A0A371DW29_9APHY|nr:hypothetical protein OH76DRAFT_1395828 [Polyporus brumalis]
MSLLLNHPRTAPIPVWARSRLGGHWVSLLGYTQCALEGTIARNGTWLPSELVRASAAVLSEWFVSRRLSDECHLVSVCVGLDGLAQRRPTRSRLSMTQIQPAHLP